MANLFCLGQGKRRMHKPEAQIGIPARFLSLIHILIPAVAVMNGLVFGSERERHPHANFGLDKSKIGRHHSDDGEGSAANA